MTPMKLSNRHAVASFTDLFDSLFNDMDRNLGRASQRWVPAANVIETADAYQLELNVPGRDKNKFVVKTENDTLLVSYHDEHSSHTNNESNGVKVLRREFKSTSFQRSFHLGEMVDANRIHAKYEDGLLKIWLPKRAEAKPQIHEISVN